MINLWRIAGYLVREGHACHVITRCPLPGEPSGPPYPGRYSSLRELRIEASSAEDLLVRDLEEAASFGSAMVRFARSTQFTASAVHTHHWSSTVDLRAWVPDSTPLVHTPHLLAHDKARMQARELPSDIAAVERAVLQRADAVIALSAAEAQTILDVYGVSEGRISVIPNTVATNFSPRPETPRLGPFRMVSVGRVARQKGFDIAVECLRMLLVADRDVVLDLIGPTYGEPDFEADLERRIASLGSDAWRVRCLGGLPHDDVLDALASADVSLNLSRFESQGIAILESLAAGIPVVAVAHPAVNEYAVGAHGAVLIDQPAAELAFDAVQQIMSDPDRRGRLGRHSGALADDTDAACRATYAVYRQLTTK